MDDNNVDDETSHKNTNEESASSALENHFSSKGYEYLDHPADVQIHSWGSNLKEAFEQAAVGMYGIMTELETVDPIQEEDIEANGHDIDSLFFNFLDECLFAFCAEPYLCACVVEITDFDKENFTIKAKLRGEQFNLDKHPQGTEVKAITYSNMQIHCKPNDCEVYFILDI